MMLSIRICVVTRRWYRWLPQGIDSTLFLKWEIKPIIPSSQGQYSSNRATATAQFSPELTSYLIACIPCTIYDEHELLWVKWRFVLLCISQMIWCTLYDFWITTQSWFSEHFHLRVTRLFTMLWLMGTSLWHLSSPDYDIAIPTLLTMWADWCSVCS